MLPAQPNQSLIDGLAVLQAVAGRREPIGGRELARQLQLEPTRVNRLLRTLAHLGLCEQDAQRKYRPGPGIHVLAAQSLFGSGLLRRAVEPLETLHALGRSVALGVLWRDQVSYLYHGEAGMSAAQGIGRAGLFPAEQSGIGIALLATRSDAEIRAACGDGGMAALLASVRHARRDGYAIATRPGGARSLGVVVPAQPRPVAAIAIANPAHDADLAALADTMRRVALAIAQPDHDPQRSTT